MILILSFTLLFFVNSYSSGFIIPSFSVGSFLSYPSEGQYESGSLRLAFKQNKDELYYAEYTSTVKNDNFEIRTLSTSRDRAGQYAATRTEIEDWSVASSSIHKFDLNDVKEVLYQSSFWRFTNLLLSKALPAHYYFKTGQTGDLIIKINHSIDNIKEAYWNQSDKIFYYVDKEDKIWCADCIAVSKENDNLVKPIAYIKDASFFDVFGIWKHVWLVLKDCYAVRNNLRLRISLLELFFNNPGSAGIHLKILACAGLLFLFSRTGMKSVKLAALLCLFMCFYKSDPIYKGLN